MPLNYWCITYNLGSCYFLSILIQGLWTKIWIADSCKIWCLFLIYHSLCHLSDVTIYYFIIWCMLSRYVNSSYHFLFFKVWYFHNVGLVLVKALVLIGKMFMVYFHFWSLLMAHLFLTEERKNLLLCFYFLFLIIIWAVLMCIVGIPATQMWFRVW